jgi:P63C domain
MELSKKDKKAAQAFARLGGLKGGKARADALTAEERREIAREAARARWSKEKPGFRPEGIPQATYGSPDRPLRIGTMEIPCYVLEDGRRVVVQSGMIRALGMSHGGSGNSGGDRLAKFVAGKLINPYISNELIDRTQRPMLFKTPSGAVAYGYEATVLANICDAVLEARKAGVLQLQQRHIAARCEILLRGFARVGIIALIDEATGYQEIRPQDALEAYLALLIRKELAVWVKKFPDEFYENIYKLKGWIWPGMQRNRFSIVAHYTRDLVYERLAPGLLEELERKSPKDEKGQRKNKLHDWLTEDVGNPLLAQHLHALVMFQRSALVNGYGWTRYVKMVDQVLPKRGANLELPLLNQTSL